MKPLELEMSAFGSYGGTEVVDFQNAEHGIFLITGDTGAGKTTIFDAVAFALFGETSGGVRDGAMMRSQYAPEDAETYVKLRFAEGDAVYEIRRSPAYDRISKRKDREGAYKKVNVPARASLTMPDGRECPGNIRSLNQKIQELIGVDREQFAQIAMIAQGEYLKLLHATSKERKAIFSRIFNTGLYGRIQMRLKEHFNRLYGQLEDNRKVAEHERNNVVLPENSGCADRWETLLQFQETKSRETLELLKEIIGEAREQEEALKIRREQGQKKLNDMEHRIAQGKETNRLFERLEEDGRTLEELNSRAEVIREQKKMLQKGRKAEKVYPAERAYTEAYRAGEQSNQKILELKAQCKDKIDEFRLEKKKLEEQEKYCRKHIPELDEEMLGISESMGRAVQELTGRKQALEQLARDLCEYDTQSRQLTEHQKKLLRHQQEFQQADEEYNRRYRLFLEAQAGIMAGELEDGAPCPVCGSKEHPKKAAKPKGEVSQQRVEDAKYVRELAEQKRGASADTCIRKSESCKHLEKDVLEAGRKWIGRTFTVAYPREELAEAAKQVGIQLKEVSRGGRKKLEQLKEEKGSLEQGLVECRAHVGRLAQEERHLKGILEAEQENAGLRKQAAIEKKMLYSQARKEQGFRSEAEYREALQKAELLNQWEKETLEYDRTLLQITTRQKQYLELTRGKEPVDLQNWQQEAERLEQEQKQLRGAEVKITALRSGNEKVYRNLRELGRARGELEEKYLIIRNLYQTANGKLTQRAGLDFQTYVQRQYFNQMVQAANRRLKIMTDGQFILQCRELEELGKQGEVGLDLDVYSVATGKKRDVKTLSGGESFMAALALALGMADIIQNTAGKVRVDTMFIDEGFGSLDEESRMRAIGILQELSGGRRSIGIISHVTELKEQIDRKLVVTKSERGSHIRWV